MAGPKWDRVRVQQRIAAQGSEPAWIALDDGRERPDPISPDIQARKRRESEKAREEKQRANRAAKNERARQKRNAAAASERQAIAQEAARRKPPSSATSIVGMRRRNDFPSCLIGKRFWNPNDCAVVIVIDADRDHVRFRQGDRERRVKLATFVALVT